MNAVDFARDALAVYRLTKLVIDDKITEDVREKVWEKYPPESTKIGYLFSCPWCVSMWVGLGAVAVKKVAPDAWEALSTAMAASAVSGILEERL